MNKEFDLEAARAGESFYYAGICYQLPEGDVCTFVGVNEDGRIIFTNGSERLCLAEACYLRMSSTNLFVNLYLKHGTHDDIVVGPCTFDDEEEATTCGPQVLWGTYLQTVAIELNA